MLDPNALLGQLSAYPTRARGDPIEWGACQWVDGTHSALNYRGHALRRAKIWCQRGDPRAFFRKYYYTGWQWRVLPATCSVAACPELAPIWDAYDAWCDANGVMRANHAIVTRYADGSHGIGAHSDKPKSIAPSVPGQTSMITVVKLGPAARRFLVTDLEGARSRGWTRRKRRRQRRRRRTSKRVRGRCFGASVLAIAMPSACRLVVCCYRPMLLLAAVLALLGCAIVVVAQEQQDVIHADLAVTVDVTQALALVGDPVSVFIKRGAVSDITLVGDSIAVAVIAVS